MQKRTCIVTRTEHSSGDLIRFVCGPDHEVVPDLRGKLPGRGVWIQPNRQLVEKAVKKGLFSHGLGTKAVADEKLPDRIEDLLRKSALQAIAIAKKAGHVVIGQEKVEALLRKQRPDVLLQAADAGNDGVRKIASALRFHHGQESERTLVFKGFSSAELDKALGGVNIAHVALLAGGATEKVTRMLNRMTCFAGEASKKNTD